MQSKDDLWIHEKPSHCDGSFEYMHIFFWHDTREIFISLLYTFQLFIIKTTDNSELKVSHSLRFNLSRAING